MFLRPMDVSEQHCWIRNWDSGLTAWLVILGDSFNLFDPVSLSVEED